MEGDASAAFKLFEFHMFVARDRANAIYWLRHAAKNGHVIAQYNLGSLLIEENDPVLKGEALAWLEKAAAAGDADARRKLSKLAVSMQR